MKKKQFNKTFFYIFNNADCEEKEGEKCTFKIY